MVRYSLLAEDLLHLLLQDLARTMMRIHDLVADLVLGGRSRDLKVLYDKFLFQHCVADGVPSYFRPGAILAPSHFRFADNGPRG